MKMEQLVSQCSRRSAISPPSPPLSLPSLRQARPGAAPPSSPVAPYRRRIRPPPSSNRPPSSRSSPSEIGEAATTAAPSTFFPILHHRRLPPPHRPLTSALPPRASAASSARFRFCFCAIPVLLLPARFCVLQVDIQVAPGTHATETAVNKQLNDKEQVAAALENPNLLDMVEECLAQTYV